MQGQIIATLVGVLAAWGYVDDARAADTWTDPQPGIRLLHRTTSAPNHIFAMKIDLCHDGVSLRATKSAERQRTVSSFAGLVDADAAINGDFFSYSDYSTSGMAIGAGELWADTADGNGSGFAVFGHGRAEIWPPAPVLAAPEPWMREMVSGRRPIVDQGVPYPADEGDLCTTRHPRTAAGLSADGRTLFLVVVDGRSSISIGMRCTELAALMLDLGAHQAINLDGGGSSTMWIGGDGVVNVPSDGAQRVVGNHLGVLARGSGEPGSCDRTWEESVLHGELADASTTTDVDGDGRDDLCARGSAGVRCQLAEDGGFAPPLIGPELSDALGWDSPTRYASLRMGDIDGDGRADLCARDGTGVRCFASRGAGLDTEIAGPALTDELGWSNPGYGDTLRMADIDGDGRDDLCARAADGLMCWRASADGFVGEAIVLDALSDANGFAAPHRWGTIRTADIDADGRVDVCARNEAGMSCWPSTGDGFAPAIVGPAWSDAAGWSRVEYWSTIRLVDIDGDRRADLCARAADGIHCQLATDTGFGPDVLGPNWADEHGWWDYSNYATIRFADIDGDGDLDLCGRANAGIRCAPWNGTGFDPAFEGPALSDDSGWGSIRFFSTIRFADIDADGRADLCARASAGMRCWISQGTSFAADAIVGPDWSDELGWDGVPYYESVRATVTRTRCLAEDTCGNGVDDDCDGEIDGGCSSDGSGGAGSEGGVDSGGAGDSGAGGPDSGGASTGLPPADAEDATAGCGCRDTNPSAPWWLVPGALLVARRPRRRASVA